jgi:bifunctional non-homologous end joining protein LigD
MPGSTAAIAAADAHGLDWTHKYSPIAAAVAVLGRAPGLSRRRIVHDPGRVGCRQRRRVGFFIFDLLRLDGDDVSALPLIERKSRLAALRWMSRRRCMFIGELDGLRGRQAFAASGFAR